MEQIKKDNRSKNSGGVYPNALKNMYSLSHVFKQVKENKVLVAWLYLWLNNRLESITTIEDLPDLIKKRNYEDCEKYAIRLYYDNTETSCEYAIEYHIHRSIHCLWQPIPKSLNTLFCSVFRSLQYDTPLLSKKQKHTLLHVIRKKQRRTANLATVPIAHKKSFQNYFQQMIQRDPRLSTLSKSVLLGRDRLHHASAMYYQSENSNSIRQQIYMAHNRYLQRLWLEAQRLQIQNNFQRVDDKPPHKKILPNPAEPHLKESMYLRESSGIAQFTIEKNKSIHRQAAPITFASKRKIDLVDVQAFFNVIQAELISLKPSRKATLSAQLSYYNLMTMVLAFQFIVCTGARPTHSIVVERNRIYKSHAAIIDKGRLRQIIINDFLQVQINRYLEFQTSILMQMNISLSKRPPTLCFVLNADGCMIPLSAKSVREAMRLRAPEIVPYQLRHFFAQFALMNVINGKLTTQMIDRLMGHSQFGEHLGSHDYFPQSHCRLKSHLDLLNSQLGLECFDL